MPTSENIVLSMSTNVPGAVAGMLNTLETEKTLILQRTDHCN